MTDSDALARRARRQLPNLGDLADILATPGAVIRALPNRRRSGGGLESMEFPGSPGVAPALPVEAEQALADGREAVLKLRSSDDVPPLTPREQIGLEAVILLFGRPALIVENGTFEPAPAGWEALEAQRPHVEAVLKSVGRIDLRNRGMIGTGFLVAPNVVMTNRHVAEQFAIPSETGGWSFKLGRVPLVDYGEGRDLTPTRLAIKSVIGIHPDARVDMALLEVDPQPVIEPPAGWTPPPVLPIAAAAPDAGDRDLQVYLIGYPASDNQGVTPPDVLSNIFGGIYEVKRLQPGTVTSIATVLPRFSHDCSTLGGNSGSCIVDLQTHKVIGLHFSGGYRENNYAVALWRFASDPLLVSAGIQAT